MVSLLPRSKTARVALLRGRHLPSFHVAAPLAVLLCVLSLGAAGMARAGSGVPHWRAGFDSGSRELALFTLMADPGLRRSREAFALARKLGMAHSGPGLQPLSTSYGISPQLTFDPNVNAGMPGEQIRLGPYLFTIDEDSRARSGWVAGARTQVSKSWSYAMGSRVSLSADAAYRHALDLPFEISETQLAACVDHYAGRWRWIGGCLKSIETRREKSDFSALSAELSFRKLFSSRFGTHEFELSGRHLIADDYDKSSLSVDLTSAMAGIGALGLGADLGEHVAGETTMLYGLRASLTRPVLGKSTRLALSYSEYGGATVFGKARRDRISRILVSRPLTRRISVTTGWESTDSTISNYSKSALKFDVTFKGWSNHH